MLVLGVGVGAAMLAVVGAFFGLVLGHSPLFVLLGLLACGLFLYVPLALAASAHGLRGRHPRCAWLAGAAAGVLVLTAGVAFGVEPRRLQVSHERVESAHITRPYRLVLLADIQTDHAGAHERRASETARDAEPDLILLAGDYVHTLGREEYWGELERLNALMREVGLTAPLGGVAVRGNCELQGWQRVFDGLDVWAPRKTKSRRFGELSITALSLEDGFDAGLSVPPQPGLHIVLSHAPDFALGRIDADLLLAGHTHGGQVRIPGFGPPVTLSLVPRAWQRAARSWMTAAPWWSAAASAWSAGGRRACGCSARRRWSC